jgi:hypothetical protein
VARRFTLITSPEPTSTFIPAPRVQVKRLADGASMGVFPMTKHQLAREIARRWRGTLELLPCEPAAGAGRAAGPKGTPR